jgi:heptosyltransferase-2
LTSDLISYFAKATYRIGARSLNGTENKTNFIYNLPVDLDWRNDPHRHQSERNLDMLRNFNIHTEDLSIEITLDEDEKKFGRDFFVTHHKSEKIAMGIHPGAGRPEQRWPITAFENLIRLLLINPKFQVFVTCGPLDNDRVEYIENIFRDKIIYIKDMNIRNVAAIVTNFDVFITQDTGMMHVGAAMDCVVLALFGPSDPFQWASKNTKDIFIRGSLNSMDTITVDEVYSKLINLLSKIELHKGV